MDYKDMWEELEQDIRESIANSYGSYQQALEDVLEDMAMIDSKQVEGEYI